MTTTEQHHHSAPHHEAPEVVHHRQRLGIWIFIAGDVVSMCALLFTYLYLRGTNTGGHWMSIEGVPARGRTMEQIQAFLEEGRMMLILHHEGGLEQLDRLELLDARQLEVAQRSVGVEQFEDVRAPLAVSVFGHPPQRRPWSVRAASPAPRHRGRRRIRSAGLSRRPARPASAAP